MDHRPLPRPRLTPSAGPFHVQGGFMWLNIITGAVMLATAVVAFLTLRAAFRIRRE